MTIDQPYPDADELVSSMGRAGQAIAAMSACEGAAGNISVCCGWPVDVTSRFPITETLELPDPVPALAGHTVIITGSGRRLREIAGDPEANLGALLVNNDGLSAQFLFSPRRRYARLTSELNSHLAVHADQIIRSGTNFHALIHAQPQHLTLLSHIAQYRQGDTLTRKLLRWEPETTVNLPEGIGVLEYALPGSPQLMAANLRGLREYQIVVWSKHGVMARSDVSVTRAADLIEYAETAAIYEHLDRSTGSQAEGLTDDELREIVKTFDIQTTLF